MLRIFLSHSSCNNREAVALKHWLSKQRPELANEIFLDIDEKTGMQLGRRWKEQLLLRNTGCEWLLCLVSRDWVNSTECLIEYHLANRTGKGIVIARLKDLTDADWHAAGKLKSDITAEWQRCDLFREGPQTPIEVAADPPTVPGGPPVSFNTAALHQIRRVIEGPGIGPEAFVWPPADEPKRAPYRGWRPFEDIDAAVFFGRDAAIASGLAQLRRMRGPSPKQMATVTKSMFVVLGPSGSGKSSFLRAGLIPRLQRDDSNFAVMGIMRAGHALTGEQGLIAAIDQGRRALGVTDMSLDDIEDACLQADSGCLLELLTKIRTTAATRRDDADKALGIDESASRQVADGDQQSLLVTTPPTLVLPLDEAEELFPAQPATEAAHFLRLVAQLLTVMNAADVGMIVAATIRTDRYEAMQTDPTLRGIGAVLFNELKPMPASEYREVIIGPARRASEMTPLTFDVRLVQRLIADAAGADTLPLLALTLDRLYRRRPRDGVLTLDQYDRMGGMRNVVNKEIEQILPADPQQREAALALLRAVFIPSLVNINQDNNRPMRRVAPEDELPEAARPLIEKLVEKRLVVRDRDERGGQVVIEVALESLFEHWKDLKGWLNEQREDLKTIHDIERSGAGWEAHSYHPDWLLTRTRLADAERFAESAQFSARLAALREFLSASRQAEDQRAADELRIERERRKAAEAVAAAETDAREKAEALTAVEQAHSHKLRRAVMVIALVAVVAVISSGFAIYYGYQAKKSSHDAHTDFLQATAERVEADALGILNRDRPGSDVRAIQEMVAATLISPKISGDTASDDAVAAAIKLSWASKLISPGFTATAASSTDGGLVASAGFDNSVRIWDGNTGAQIGEPLTGHHNRISGVAFSPDGHRLVSSSVDGELRLWDVDKTEQITCVTTAGSPCPAQPDPSSHDPAIWSLAYSTDGKHLATADDDNNVLLWDPQSLRRPAVLAGHKKPVLAVAFSSDGHRLASGSQDGSIRLWNADNGTQVGQQLRGQSNQSDPILTVAFSPDGQRLVSGSFDGSIRMWNGVNTDRPVCAELLDKTRPHAVHTAPVNAVAFSPDGGIVMSGSADGTIRWWDADSGYSMLFPSTRHGDSVQTVKFNRWCDYRGENCTLGALSASTIGGIQVWQDIAKAIPLEDREGPSDSVTTVAFNPKNPGVIASGSTDHHVIVWQPGSRSNPAPRNDMQDGAGIGWLAFNPDGTRIASASWDGKIYIWDPRTGQPADAGVIPTHMSSVAAVAYSPDGRIVSGANDHAAKKWSVQVWDAQTGAQLGAAMTGTGPPLQTVAISSPNGALIASAGDDGTIRLWDTSTRELRGQLTGHTDSVYSVAFSPDGTHLVSGSWDGTVRIWDVERQIPVGKPLTGHVGKVRVVTYSPDGRYIASSGDDGTIRLWNAQTGNPVGAPLTAGSDVVEAVAFSPDDTELVSAGDDQSLHLWPFPFDAQNTLCEKIASNMSHQHWNEWISDRIDYQLQCPGKPIDPDS